MIGGDASVPKELSFRPVIPKKGRYFWPLSSSTLSDTNTRRRPLYKTLRVTMDIKAVLCFLISSLWANQPVNAGNLQKQRNDSGPINCFVCYSCNRVELSQSLPCPEDHDRCMVIDNNRYRSPTVLAFSRPGFYFYDAHLSTKGPVHVLARDKG